MNITQIKVGYLQANCYILEKENNIIIKKFDEIDKKYPEYGFKNHKGYPTKKHLEAINKYGLIEGYRKTYGPVKNYIENGTVRKE